MRKAFLKVPLLFVALALICGIEAGNGSWGWIGIGIVFSLVPLFTAQWRLSTLSLLCVLAGCLQMDGLRKERDASFTSRQKEADTIMVVTGSITRVYTTTAWLECDDGKEKLEVRFPENKPPALGERWSYRGMAEPIEPPRTPGAFDRRDWLSRNGIATRLNVFEGQCLGDGNFKSRMLALSSTCRKSIANILSENGTREDTPTQIMISMLLGDKSSLPSEVMDGFRTSGSLHIFAVSGLHVGLAAGILLYFLYFLPIHPLKSRALALILLAAYVFITGMPPSAVRAYIMVSFLVLGLCLRRPTHPINTLSLAAIAILSYDSWQLFDPGFQLSFLIFGTIVVIAGLENRLLPWWKPDSFIPSRIYSPQERFLVRQERNIRLLLAVSFASWLVSIPITATHFGTVNLYSTLTNLLMAPFLAPLMGFSMMSVLTHWIPMASVVFNACARVPAAILLFVSQWVADQPCALTPWTADAPPMAGIALALPGQGYCVALGNPGILINCGNEYAARQIVTPALRACGFSPRYLILTHASTPLTGGKESIQRLWPGIHELSAPPSSSVSPHSLLHKSSGNYAIYPVDKRFSTGISADNAPAILWEQGGKRLLFIGDAAMSSLLMLPDEALKADIILMGRNPHDPVDDPEWILQTGAKDIVFLREHEAAFDQLPDTIRFHHLQENSTLNIHMAANEKTVSPWQSEEREERHKMEKETTMRSSSITASL